MAVTSSSRLESEKLRRWKAVSSGDDDDDQEEADEKADGITVEGGKGRSEWRLLGTLLLLPPLLMHPAARMGPRGKKAADWCAALSLSGFPVWC
mmetsp:Transcript_90320/g.180292  ORF Transcript_90320/g.180292 Transcript_90320/m.180292 type:complete len:94 (-) Transcript_90320:209-490(-)